MSPTKLVTPVPREVIDVEVLKLFLAYCKSTRRAASRLAKKYGLSPSHEITTRRVLGKALKGRIVRFVTVRRHSSDSAPNGGLAK